MYNRPGGFFALQRQESVLRRSFKVRGMGPPQGPTFVSAVPTMNKAKNQKLKKLQVLLRTARTIKHFAFPQRAPKWLIGKILAWDSEKKKLSTFLSHFLFFFFFPNY